MKSSNPYRRNGVSIHSLEKRLLFAAGAGDLATRFNGTGEYASAFGYAGAQISAVAVQSDGKIVVAGEALLKADDDSSDEFLVARFNPNGTLDTTFGSGGHTAFSPLALVLHKTGIQSADAISIASNGSIVLGGYGLSGGAYYGLFARVTKAGVVDSGFGANGASYTQPAGSAFDRVTAVQVEKNGMIAVAGTSDADGFVGRLTSKGLYDTTFNKIGYRLITLPQYEGVSLFGLTLDGKGNIVAVGGALTGDGNDSAVFRITPAGALDTTFGSNGAATFDVPTLVGAKPAEDLLNAVTLDAKGNIVAVGQAYVSVDYDATTVRLKPNGALDTTFGIKGGSFAGLGSPNDAFGQSVAIQPDGKIVLGGDSDGVLAVARLQSNGYYDTTFHGTGYSVLPASLPGQLGQFEVAALTPDGNIIAAGSGLSGNVMIGGAVEFQGDPTTIAGTLFNDVNGDGKLEAGDGPLAGWTVFLDSNGNGRLDRGETFTTSSKSGHYALGPLPAGTYSVMAVSQSGYRVTLPTTGKYAIATVCGKTYANENFGFTRRALITGTVYDDLNNNGVKDASDKALSGWTVDVDVNSNGIWKNSGITATTTSTGGYAIALPAAEYRIRLILKSGYHFKAPASGNYVMTLTAAAVASGRNFGVEL